MSQFRNISAHTQAFRLPSGLRWGHRPVTLEPGQVFEATEKAEAEDVAFLRDLCRDRTKYGKQYPAVLREIHPGIVGAVSDVMHEFSRKRRGGGNV